MDNPFKAAAQNVGNVYRDKDGETYLMVQPEHGKFSIVMLFGKSRWAGLLDSGDVFEDSIGKEPILEYTGKIHSVKVKREIIHEVMR